MYHIMHELKGNMMGKNNCSVETWNGFVQLVWTFVTVKVAGLNPCTCIVVLNMHMDTMYYDHHFITGNAYVVLSLIQLSSTGLIVHQHNYDWTK